MYAAQDQPGTNDHIREALEAQATPAWIYCPATLRILAVNSKAVAHYGYTEDQFLSMTLEDVRPRSDVPRFRHYAKKITPDTRDSGTWRHIKNDGSIIDVHVVSSSVEWNGQTARLALLRDVTAEKQSLAQVKAYREQLERSETALRAAQSVAHIGSWDLNIVTGEVIWSDELYRIYGLDRESFPATPGTLWQFDHPDDVDEVRRQYEYAQDHHSPYSIIHRLKRRDGSIRWVHELGQFEYDASGVAVREIGTIQDITDRKLNEDRLAFLANFDTLTGLPNRSLLEDRLRLAMAEARRDGRLAAVAFIDIDNFKHVNDSLGHNYGDLLLKEVADRLGSGLRKTDTIYRYNSDEFIVILNDVKSPDDAAAAATRLLVSLQAPIRLAERAYRVSASAGISVFPDDAADFELLVQHADIAMQRAKASGRGTVRFYSAGMQTIVTQRLRVENELQTALVEGQFQLHYQPIIELISRRVVGAEALVRWQHPELGLLMPAQFIEVAEDTGMIVEIGRWVLRQACADAAAWRDEGCDPIPVAVNVSPRQFREAALLEHVAGALERAGLPPELLHIEITESLVMDPESVECVASGLEALGVQLILDDFGTGFSSLSRLGRFPVNGLKIDRSFVAGLDNSKHSRTIARAIVSLAKSLNLTVVGEGIETMKQLTALAHMGCTVGQGYYFSKPIPEAEFRSLALGAQRLDQAAT